MEKTPFKIAFKQALTKYINAIDGIDIYNAKTDVLIAVDCAEKQESYPAIREVLTNFWHLPAELADYFIPGSFFIDDGLVFGWYRPDQVRAECLPVRWSKGYDKGFFNIVEVIHNRDGFRVAVPLPLSYGAIVSIPAGQHHLFARYGWAAPVALQWYRTKDSYIVYRSIVYCGFCVAWSLRPDAAEHYAKHPPDDVKEVLFYSGELATDF